MACPTCRKPESPNHKPFCSKRCKEVDLGRWFSGRYAVPTEEAPQEDALTSRVEDEAD